MFNLSGSKKKIFSGILLTSVTLIMGCFGGSDSTAPTNDGHLKVTMGIARVGGLAKTSTISLNKLVITLISTSNDTVADTLTSTTTPALSPIATTSQSYSMNFTVAPLRVWQVIAKTLDANDSIIHLGSTTTPMIEAGASDSISLNLSARYAMYEADFLNIPDSISSPVLGTAKQVLHIRRLVLMVDGITEMDSTRQQYFTPNTAAILPFDYLAVGQHTIQLMEYGPMNSWSETKPLYSGSTSLNVVSGTDATTSMTLNWVGPTSANGKVTVVIGKVGTITLNGTTPGSVLQ